MFLLNNKNKILIPVSDCTGPAALNSMPMDESFCFFFQKEALSSSSEKPKPSSV
jgi:hypothetical protein